MKSRSIKQKGKNLENLVRKKILDYFPELCDNIRVTIGQEKGADLKLSGEALKVLPYSFECKARASVVVYNWLEQNNDYNKGELTPVVVFKANRKRPLIALDLEDFLQLIKNKKEK